MSAGRLVPAVPLAALAFLVLLSISPVAVLGGSERESLRGLGGIAVVVEDIPDQEALFGISATRIKTDVELRLREHAISVTDSSLLYVYIQVRPLRIDEYSWAVSLRVEFVQPVLTMRDALKHANSDDKSEALLGTIRAGFLGTTWQDDALLILGSEKLGRIRERLADMTNAFINDYFAANPK